MHVRAFIDTNIFIYTQRTDAPDKKVIAEEAIHFLNVMPVLKYSTKYVIS
jgi:predicted nucleic acid-binding protein